MSSISLPTKRTFSQQPPLRLEDKVPFGKHKGKTVQETYLEDSGYLVWMRDARRAETAFFAYEVHCLLDMTITESKSLRGKYPLWNVQQDGMDATTAQPAVAAAVPQSEYSGAWGAF